MQKPSVQQALRLAALVAVSVAASTATANATQDYSSTTLTVQVVDSPIVVLPSGGPRDLGVE